MSDWQPIETAPKDGTRFLANNNRVPYEPYAVSWLIAERDDPYDYDHWGDAGYHFQADYFTHWQPLPEPPK